MKTAVYFKHFLSAFAALVLLGVASSCKDQNFDWENAHSLTSVEKFTDTFIKEFGQPADGHQWGFDMLWNQSSTRAVLTGSNVIKPDMGGKDNCDTRDFYGVATNITELEHKEVYEWFSTHKVTWTNTTSIVGSIKAGDKLYDSNNSEVVDTDANRGKIIENGKVKLTDGTEISGTFCIIKNGNSNGDIVKYVWGTGTRNGGTTTLAKKTAELSSDNTLRTYSPDCVGDVNVGLQIDFTHAWIQHVAYDKDANVPDRTKERDLRGNYVFQYNSNGQQTESKMDFLQFYLNGSATAHTNDFNGNGGNQANWGWGNQDTSFPEGGKEYPKNGILMLNANFSNTSYQASLGGVGDKTHDKWILVYLAGENYAGWYLGFDFESNGSDWGACVGANGYCNNWIVKLSNVNPFKYAACRIMCEDLGGLNNEVTIGSGENKKVHISDIDYNDIVIDVLPQRWDEENSTWVDDPGSSNVTLRLQAAGGTLPLTVWYDEQALFETHELLEQDLHYTDSNNNHDATYSTMYNTDADNGISDNRTKEVHLIFEQSFNNKDQYKNYNRKGLFDIERLHIKVWRHTLEDYRNSANGSYSDADWVTLRNYEGSAPLKICVPTEVKWLKERKAVTEGYPSFRTWVGEPTAKFWVTDGYSSPNLYGN